MYYVFEAPAIHGDLPICDVRIGGAIVGFVREAVGTAVVRGRGVREAAVRAQRERAVGRTAHEDCRERAVFDVGVVGQDSRRGDRERRIFGGGVAVSAGDRRVVPGGAAHRKRL